MTKTKIDWADSTWNPVTGCLHNCDYCYARKIANRFGCHMQTKQSKIHELDEPYLIDGNKTPYPFDFTPTFHRYRLTDYLNKKSRTIFVCSMADLFGDWVPDEWIKEVFAACEKAPQHQYLFLTKNPKRYQALAEQGVLLTNKNMWYGITAATPNAPFWININHEYNTFLSIEPIMQRFGEDAENAFRYVDWVIIGAETGNRKNKIVPARDWIDEILDFCDKIEVPVFLKNSLADIMGGEKNLRQDYPKGLKT